MAPGMQRATGSLGQSLPMPGDIIQIGVLGFPKIEIKSKHQRNFQADLIKLMLEHQGDSTEEQKVL